MSGYQAETGVIAGRPQRPSLDRKRLVEFAVRQRTCKEIPGKDRLEYKSGFRLGSVFLTIFNGLHFGRYRVHNIDHRFHFEFKNREYAREIMNVC